MKNLDAIQKEFNKSGGDDLVKETILDQAERFYETQVKSTLSWEGKILPAWSTLTLEEKRAFTFDNLIPTRD